jgi:hypothetical protein
MKIIRIGEPKIIMNNPYSLHNYFGWPTVARLQNGKLAVVASGFRLEHVCPFGKAVISYSEDEGEHYTAPAPVIDTVLDDRDGGILAFGESGVMVTSFNNTKKFQQKYAKGRAQEAYRLAYLDQIGDEEEARDLGANFRISMDGGVTFGEIYKSPVTSPHGPAELADGSILWVGRTFSRNDALMSQDCVCAYRVDPENGGMEYLGRIDNVVIDGERMLSCEPHAIELEDGSILCHIRVQSAVSSKLHFTIYQSISQDGGRSWSEPKPLLPKLGGSPAHIIRHSSGALISVYGYREFPYGIKVMFSLDNGKTWDTNHDLYVNGVSSDLGYPSTAELSDGSLLTVFYAHPEQGAPAVIMQQKWRMENEI